MLVRFVLFFLCLFNLAFADADDIKDSIAARLPDNTDGEISPEDVRESFNDVIDNLGDIDFQVSVTTASITTATIDTVVGNITVSGTVNASAFVSLGQAQFASMLANINSARISDTNGGLGITAQQVYQKQGIDVRDYGVVVDGQPHAGNVEAAQRVLNLARNGGIKVDLCPKAVSGTQELSTVYGTYTTLDAELPLKYLSNTMIVGSGVCEQNIRTSHNAFIEGYYESLSDTAAYKQHANVQIIGLRLVTTSRTDTTPYKGIVMTNMKPGTNNAVIGNIISDTNSANQFRLQTRNGGDILMAYNKVYTFPTASTNGYDACHKHANSDGEQWLFNTCWGQDDGCSETLESTAMNDMVQRNGLWMGNDCRSAKHSGMKHSSGESSAANAKIINSSWVSNFFGTTSPSTGSANAWKIQQDNTNGSYSDGLSLINNTVDCVGCENSQTGGGPNGTIIAEEMCGVRNVIISGQKVVGWINEGVEITPNVCNWKYSGGKISGYVPIAVAVTSSMNVSYTSANTLQVYPSNTALVTTSLVSTSADYYVSATAGAMMERWEITGVSSTGGFFTVNRISASTTTSLTNISATIQRRPGKFFDIRGNNRNGVVENVEIVDPPTFVDINQQSSGNNHGLTLQKNKIYGFGDNIAITMSAGAYVTIKENECIDSFGNRCISVVSSSNITSYTLIGNYDKGTSTNHGSFNATDPDFLEKYDNVGTNSDKRDVFTYNKLNMSQLTAVSGTVTGQLVAGTISTTDSPSPSLFRNVSVTQNVSVTGNLSAGGAISATSFLGYGGSLTGITASAAAAGNAGQLQVNNGDGSTSGTASVTYSSATNILASIGGVSVSAVISATGGINAAASSGADIFFGATNDSIDHNDASSRFSFTENGTEELRITTSAVNISNNSLSINAGLATPVATLEVSGTAGISGNISTTTGYMHLGSPTTVPTCDTANRGNVYINTTTSCLVYCNGTSATAISSAASGC